MKENRTKVIRARLSEEEKEQVSATEEANNTEAFADGPEVVDVETTISNAAGEIDTSGE